MSVRIPGCCRIMTAVVMFQGTLATGACAGTHQRVVAPNGVHCTGFLNTHPGYSCYEEIAGRPGIRCSGYVSPSPQGPQPAPPTIYSVRDLGKIGVPALSREQSSSLLDLQNSGLKSLYFAFLPKVAHLPSFIAFNADRGVVCANWAGGYTVLNDNPDGRIFYEPGENPYTVLAAPP